MATIRELAKELVRDTEDAQIETRDGVEGVYFLERVNWSDAEFTPFNDLGYNANYGFFSR